MNIDDISEIPPTDLEEFIAELWDDLGWEASTTSATGDDGVDVVVQREEPYEQKKLIQVKQRDDRLDRSKVQQYSYLHHKDEVDEVLLVGTSGFTGGAIESANEANVKLIGPDEIEKMLKKADADYLVEGYVGSDTGNEIDTSASDRLRDTEHSYDTEEFERFSSTGEVYAELANSIPCSDMCSPKSRLAIALQFFRGSSPLHVLLVAEKGDEDTQLLKYIVELHDNSAYVNCQTTTEDGLIGRYNSSGRTHSGVFTQHDGGVIALDNTDELSSPKICEEPLTEQEITVSRAGFHRSYSTDFSCLATVEPKYGRFDQYESMLKQIETPLMEYFDCVSILSDASGDVTLPQGYLDIEDREGSSVGKLNEYSRYANEKYSSPELTATAKRKMEEILADWRNYDEGMPVSNSTRTSFASVAKAGARMRLSDRVQEVDVVLASNVLAQSLAGIDPRTGEFDIDVIESGTSQEERERIKTIRDVIERICERSDDGKAALSEIIDMAKDSGMSEEKVKNEIDSLRRSGELIEPEKDKFRLF